MSKELQCLGRTPLLLTAIRTAICLILTHALVHGATIWVPTTTNGNARSGAPFAIGSPATARLQEVYSASAFPAGAGGVMITALHYRYDCMRFEQCNGPGIPDGQINLSTTTKTVDGLSATFAANIGADESIAIPRGAIPFQTLGAPDYYAQLELSNPFFYDPTRGNLLVDIRVWQGNVNQGLFDAEASLGDAISGVYFDGIGNAGVDSPTGSTGTGGLVTGFLITPVPEPTTIWLLGAGLLVISAGLWRANGRSKLTHRPERSRRRGGAGQRIFPS